MPSKVERFGQWRGEKATAEKDILNTALFISDYINSVELLSTIKADFTSSNSPRYKAFNKYDKRSLGILVFCKLILDESIDKIPQASQESVIIKERQLLCDIRNILNDIYIDYTKNPTQRVANLIVKTKQLLDLDTAHFYDAQQTKLLCFTLYLMLCNINLVLVNLSGIKKILVGKVIKIEEMKADVMFLLQKTELKVNQINGLMPVHLVTNAKTVGISQPIQDSFNTRYLKLFNTTQDNNKKFILINDIISKVTVGITALVNARSEQAEIASKIFMIKNLHQSVLENEKKVSGRRYFLDLINNNSQDFEILLNTLPASRRHQFEEKIGKLKSPSFYQGVTSTLLFGMSWATSLTTLSYRTLTPQSLQDTVTNTVPATLDSECKSDLKDLMESSLLSLNKKLTIKDKEITHLTAQLANGSKDLEQLITHESSESLLALVEPNNAAKEAINTYWQLSIALNDKAHYLQTIKDDEPVLTQFIKTHDGFLVKLSNLFGLILPIFKSETAKMIDSARDMKNRLKQFEQNYYKEIKIMMSDLEKNQELSKEIKVKLKELVRIDAIEPKTKPMQKPVSLHDLRTLITKLTELFHPAIEKNALLNNPASNSLLQAK